MDIIGGIAAATEGLKLVNELRRIDKEIDKAELKLRLVDVVDKLIDANKMAIRARWGQEKPQTFLVRFDPRQIGPRLPPACARRRRSSLKTVHRTVFRALITPRQARFAPARQARPDFQPLALAGPPLFNGFQPYEQCAGKRSPGAFSCGPKACPDHSKEDGRAAVGAMA